MARTIRRRKTVDPTEYRPSKRARKIEKRSRRQADRQTIHQSMREFQAC